MRRKVLTWWCLVVVSRFFVLNNEAGLLEYFVNEQSRPQKPRGMLPLAGAVISPSDEDSHTFTVNAISGEQYKLRGGSDNTQKVLCQHVVCALMAQNSGDHLCFHAVSLPPDLTVSTIHQVHLILIWMLSIIHCW